MPQLCKTFDAAQISINFTPPPNSRRGITMKHVAASCMTHRRIGPPLIPALYLLGALGIVGCSAEVAETSESHAAVSEDELLRDYLAQSGFDTTHSIINHELGSVTVDDDGALSLDDVREQLYVQKGYNGFGMTASYNTPSGPVTPYTITRVTGTNVHDIKLIFETPQTHSWATEPVNVFWKAAFQNAAQQWSGTGSSVRISETNRGGGNGASISIIMTTQPFCDNNGDGINDCWARSAFPGFGLPGHYILVDPTYAPQCPGGTIPPGCSGGNCFTRLMYVAVHELGHTIGFMHPGCGTRILGTGSDPDCGDGSAYQTEMVTPTPCNDSGVLKSDDYESVRRTYL
jgi:hypothetical protein